MDPLSIAAGVAGLLTLTGTIISKGYACMSRVKKSDGDIEHMLKEVASLSGILVGLKSHYSEAEALSTPLNSPVRNYETIWLGSITDCEKTLTELVGILDSLASAKAIRLIMKGESMASRVESLVSRIEQFKSFFILYLQLESSADSKEITRLVVEIRGLLHRVMEGQVSLKSQIEAQQNSETREKVTNWLGPTSEAVQEDIIKDKNAHSSQWLIERSEFQCWLTSDGAANFWLWGIQGSGKTVAVSRVIELVQNQYLEEGDVLIYHYCRFSESVTLSSQRLIGAMIAQLLNQTNSNSTVLGTLAKLLTKYRASSYPSLKELEQPFFELCQCHSRVFVIIDGLDEINDRTDVLKFISSLASVGGSFKVFVSSRPETDLEPYFESFISVAITHAEIQQDLQTYVQERFEKLQIGDNEEIDQLAVALELVQRAQGMFLWAVCQIDHLSRIRTAITLDILTSLPRGLENTFEAVLQRLEEEDQLLAQEILRVVMFSRRSLDLSEVVEAVAVSPTVRSLKQLRRKTLRRPADVFQLCGSLIHQSRSTGKISLSHYSVQEFLSRPFLDKGRRNIFFLEEAISLQKQLECCISYLSMEEFASDTFRETFRLAQDERHIDSDLQIFAEAPFLDYASNHWAAHLESLGSEGMQLVWSPLLEDFFFGKRGSFRSWILVAQYFHGIHKFPEGADPIHTAVLHGHEPLSRLLLRRYPDCLNVPALDGRTPLHIALENELGSIAYLLIEQGASLKSRDGKGRTPLHAAIESGSRMAVEQLVIAGADVNAVHYNGETPITVAIENRWDDLADLLARNADPKVLLLDKRSLLHIAAQSGSLIWTTALLEFHADRLINAQDENGWTPLHYAADKQHAQIAQILISFKCLINVFDKNGWTPLHATIRHRNLECASMILRADWSRGILRTVTPSSTANPAAWMDADERQISRPRFGMLAKYGNRSNLQSFPNLMSSSSTRHTLSSLGSLDFDDRDPFQGRLERAPKESSPLHLAVADSYSDGVELLLRYPDKLALLDISYTEKLECLKVAISLDDIEIAKMLIKSLEKQLASRAIFSLIPLHSRASLEWLSTVFTINEAYEDFIPRAFALDGEDLVRFILQTWPDADGSLVDKALTSAMGQSRVGVESEGYKKDHLKLAKIFVGNGVLPSKILMEQSKRSLLHVAILAQDLKFATFLIKSNANVDFETEEGETPLLVLAGLGPPKSGESPQSARLDLVGLLISRGVNAQALDKRGRGFCHRAAAAGNHRLLEYALETLKLHPGLQDKYSRTPLLLAVENGSWEAVGQLLKHLAINDESNDSSGPERIIEAMEYANLRSSPLLRAMIDREERRTSIIKALVEADEMAFVKLSRERKTDLEDLRVSFYIEALCWAIDCDFLTGFTYLLPKIPKTYLFSHANLDSDGVLHCAAGARRNDHLQTLLQRLKSYDGGEDVMQKSNAKGKTPLDIAVEIGSFEKTEILLHANFKPTPLQIQMAKKKGNAELEALLRRHSSDPSPR